MLSTQGYLGFSSNFNNKIFFRIRFHRTRMLDYFILTITKICHGPQNGAWRAGYGPPVKRSLLLAAFAVVVPESISTSQSFFEAFKKKERSMLTIFKKRIFCYIVNSAQIVAEFVC